ncbi:hypothetical protein KR009_011873, partial [Drosophila setifemur]
CLHFSKLIDDSIIYKIKNIECMASPGFSANPSCRLKALNWNKAVAQMDVDLLRPLLNITVKIQLYKKDYSNKFQPFLINVIVNICDLLSKRSFMPYGVMLVNIAKKFSNLNHSCPFEGHLMARDAFFDVSLIPNHWPMGLYKIAIDIMENYPSKRTDNVGAVIWYIESMIPFKKKK